MAKLLVRRAIVGVFFSGLFLALLYPDPARAETLATTVAAVGARPNVQSRINDTKSDGSQQLASRWHNGSTPAEAWFTLDTQSLHDLALLQIAVQGGTAVQLEISAGTSLIDGQVEALVSTLCTTATGSSVAPSDLFDCALVFPGVRYVTVRALNVNRLSVYGVEVEGAQANGTGNFPPIADFSVSAAASPLTFDFDAQSSLDADGTITSFDWAFGDGTTGSGVTASHSYAEAGEFDVTLTVTDDLGATGQRTELVSVSPEGPTGELSLSIHAIGARGGNAHRLLDETGAGEPDLTTSWISDDQVANAWFTLDLGSSVPVANFLIAARGDVNYRLVLAIGDSLDSNRVTNGVEAECETPGDDSREPSVFTSCFLGGMGRYLSVRTEDQSRFRVYGLQVEQAAGNQPPALAPLDDLLVTAGFPVTQPIVATDPDGPAPLTLGHSSTIPGDPLVLDDQGDGTGSLAWNDTTGQTGVYAVTVTASDDDGAEATAEFQIEVVDNQAPVIDPIDSQQVTEAQELTFDAAADDPDSADPVVFTESHDLPGQPLVFTDNLDGTASFRWTPQTGDQGEYTVQLLATDVEGETTTQSFAVVVVENQPPQFADIAPLFAVEEQTLTGIITATDNDSPGSPMLSQTNTLPGMPDVLVDNQDGSASLSYLPAAGDAGTYDITFSAISADGGSNQVTVPVTVSDNSIPGFLTLAAEQAPDQINLTELGLTDWANWYFRSDGLVVRKSGGGAVLGDVVSLDVPSSISRFGYGKAFYSWSDGTPTASASNSRDVGRVQEPGQGFRLELPAGPMPRSVTLYLGASKATGSLSAMLSDGSAAPAALSIVKTGGKTTQAVTIDYRAASPGASLQVDWLFAESHGSGGGWISVEAGTYSGPPPNQAPDFAVIPDQEVRVGESLNVQVIATDPDGPAPISFSQSNTLPGATLEMVEEPEGTVTLTWVRDSGVAAGEYSVTVTASDADGEDRSRTFAVNVPENQPPLFDGVADVLVTGGDLVAFQVSSNDPDDLAAPMVVADLALLPPGASFVPDDVGGGAFQWQTTAEDVAAEPYIATFTATDGYGAQSELQVAIEVMPNQPPTVLPLVDRSVTEGRTLVVPLQVSDPDDESALTLTTISGLPEAFDPLVDLGDNRWELRWTPAAGDAQSVPYSVSVTATDGHNNSHTQTLYVRVLDASAGIQLAPDAPNYWQFGGQTVLLVGGSEADSIFQWDATELIAHLDLLHSVGGNYLRVAQNWRNFDTSVDDFVFDQLPQPWLKGTDGRYDLDTDNPAYWDGLQRLLHETAQRGIVVQLELWDAYALIHRVAWPDSGWNPDNNSSYGFNNTQLVDGSVDITSRNFFEAIPELNNDALLLSYQQRFVDKVLQIAGPYNHVLYQLDNESYLPPAVSNYWANYIHSHLPYPAFVADSRRYHRPSFEQTNFQDPAHPDNVVPVSNPLTYTFMDLAQNGGNTGQIHYDNLLWYQAQVNAVAPRPINHTKMYAYAWPTGTLFRDRFALPVHQQTAKFWRTIFGGAAAVRFHRYVDLDPLPGLGLGALAQMHIASAQSLASAIQLAEFAPAPELLDQRSDDEAYLLADGEGNFAVLFTSEGDTAVELLAPGAFYVRWLNPNTNVWLPSEVAPVNTSTALQTPDGGQWIAVLDRNAPPELDPLAPVSLFAGETLTVQVTASDPDGAETITLSASNNIGEEPDLLTVTGDGTATISWLVPGDQPAGDVEITVTATDDAQQSVQQVLVVTVLENLAPVIAPLADVTLQVGDSLNVLVSSSDPDGPGDTLIEVTSTIDDDPELFTSTGSGIGSISWTPEADEVGDFTITVTATDSLNNASQQQFVVSVQGNQPPVIQAVADVTLFAGQSLSVPVSVTDADGPGVDTIEVTSTIPSDPALYTPETATTGTIAWDPQLTDVGLHVVTVVATDTLGVSTMLEFSVTVVANAAPVITPIADVALKVGESLSAQVVATDVDGPGATTIEVASTVAGDPELFTSTGDGTGVINWLPGIDDLGTTTVTITATDTLGNSVDEVFVIEVSENVPPSLTSLPDVSVFIGETLNVPVSATDPDGPGVASIDVSSTIPSDPDLYTPLSPSNGTISWSPELAEAGVHTVTVTATDGLGVSTVAMFDVTALVNSAPQIDAIDDQLLQVGSTLSVAVSATDVDGPGDIDLSVETLLPGAPDVFSATGPGAGLIEWTPDAAAVGGPYSVTVTAADALGNEATLSFLVTVEAQPSIYSTSIGKPPTDIVLSEEGTTDWVHWGLGDQVAALNRKAGGSPRIGDFVASSAQVRAQLNERPAMSWAGGAPTPSAFTTDAIRFRNANGGPAQLSIAVDGAETAQRFTLYLGVRQATVTLTTSGAATDTSVLSAPFNKQFFRVVFDFPGSPSAEDLNVAVELTDTHGNNGASVVLAGATLAPWVDTAPLSGLLAPPDNQSCVASERPLGAAGVALNRRFAGLSFAQPVAARFNDASGPRWYVAQKTGEIRFFDATDDDVTETSTFLDLSGVVDTAGENGLLGFAFHPDFASNGQVFVSYVETVGEDTQSVLSRFTVLPSGDQLDPASEQIVLTQPQLTIAHNAGDVAFDAAGYLYWSLGDDGAAGNDPLNSAQNPQSLLGAILRLDVDGGSPYAIPADNPFAVSGGAEEVFAYGLRNPWRMSFDSLTGDFYVADVGQNEREEINRVVAGGNYGWRCYEGTRLNTNVDLASCGLASEYEFPIAEYDHTEGRSVTGGYVYRGGIASLSGVYVFADFVTGSVWGLFDDTVGGLERRLIASTSLNIVAFGQDDDGELIAVDFQGGLYGVDDAPPGGTNPLPSDLAATGCVDMANPALPASGLLGYRPAARFWSDGALKSRSVGLPSGTSVALDNDGDFLFPVGTVLVKTFELGDQPIETRLYMRHSDGGWGGYSYEWNADASAATLVGQDGKTVPINGQDWRFPSRGECSACHTASAGFSLGLTAAQLNSPFEYTPGNSSNQLRTWEHIGHFEQPLLNAHLNDAQIDPENTQADLGRRARSYLDTNCAACHQPGGGTQSALDLRRATALEDVGACDVVPQFDDLGLPNARIVAPGVPASSVLLERMSDPAHRMPPIGSTVIDADGVTLISSWIENVVSCP